MRKMIALAGTVALVLLAGIATAEIVAVGKFQLKGLAGENIGERFIYKVNGTMVAVIPGDLIDGCLVDGSGRLKCPSNDDGEFSKPLESVAQLQERLLRKNIEIEKAISAVRDLESDVSALQAELLENRDLVRDKSVSIRDLEFRLDNTQMLLDGSRSDVEETNSSAKDLHSTIISLRSDNIALGRMQDFYKEERAKDVTEANEKATAFDKLKSQVDAQQQRIRTLIAQTNRHEAMMLEKEQVLRGFEVEVGELESKLTATKAVSQRNVYLEDAVEKLRNLAEELTLDVAEYKRSLVVKGWNL